MHYENWFPTDVVNRLKLRASWGKTGNNNLTYSDTQGEYGVYAYGGNGGVLNSVLANDKLIWETTSNVDLGFDAGFFDNRLELSLTGYCLQKQVLLLSKPILEQYRTKVLKLL